MLLPRNEVIELFFFEPDLRKLRCAPARSGRLVINRQCLSKRSTPINVIGWILLNGTLVKKARRWIKTHISSRCWITSQFLRRCIHVDKHTPGRRRCSTQTCVTQRMGASSMWAESELVSEHQIGWIGRFARLSGLLLRVFGSDRGAGACRLLGEPDTHSC